MSNSPGPLVSVIVPTRDSEDTLERCLRSIEEQTAACELIVVDNHSRDGTLAVAERVASKVIVAGPERSTQRNVGLRSAGSPFVLFVDSDMVLEKDVVAQCLSAVGDSDAGAVIIPEVAEGDGFLARCRALEKELYLGDPEVEAARFFDRDLVLSIGGYDEELHAGEDWDLHSRVVDAGAPVARTDARIRHQEGRISLPETFATKRYYGGSLVRYRAKHPERSARQLSLRRAAFFKQPRLLLRNPLIAGGLFVLKAVELLGVRTGMRRARRELSRAVPPHGWADV